MRLRRNSNLASYPSCIGFLPASVRKKCSRSTITNVLSFQWFTATADVSRLTHCVGAHTLRSNRQPVASSGFYLLHKNFEFPFSGHLGLNSEQAVSSSRGWH